MTVWDRNARGNVKPTRKLHTPMATFGIAADEENQQLLLTVQDNQAVVTFKKNAKDLDGPVRLLQGPKTRMADPHGIAVEPKTGLMYVTNWGTVNERQAGGPPRFGHALWPIGRNNNIPGTGRFEPPSITVFRKDASGDVAPLRVIQGPKTGLNWPTSIAVHPDRGELFVANDTADTVTVYRTDSNGDAVPIRVLKGPRSMIKNPTGVALDLKNNELWVANFGGHSATVFPVDAAGDPTPKRVIRSGRAEEGPRCSVTPTRWPTIQNETRFSSQTEWPIRKLRHSPGWRMVVRSRREQLLGRILCLRGRFTIWPTTTCTTRSSCRRSTPSRS